MSDLQYLLEFILQFSERMLVSGVNLEQVNDTVYRICDSYDLQDVQFFPLNSYLSLSMQNAEGQLISGQRRIWNGVDTHLENARRLQVLARQICDEKPAPEKLEGMLEETLDHKDYPAPLILIGFLVAMTGMTGVFGGSARDLAVVLLNTVLIYLAGLYLKKWIPNKIVYNIACTFVAGSIAIFFYYQGLADDVFTVMIINSMMLIPGISMVNSFRNILCGNEINGLVEFFKVLLETIAIVGGYVLSIYLFGGGLS